MPPPPVSYRLNGARITLRECLWEASPPVALLGWVLLKFLGKQAPVSTDDPPVESLEPFGVSQEELPPEATALLRDGTAELVSLGFHSPAYHAIYDPIHRTNTFLATFAHRSMPVVARVHIRIWALKRPRTKCFAEFITAFDDGTFLWSLSSKPDMLAPKSCTIVRAQGATARDLWRLHERALVSHPSQPPRRPLPAHAREHALAVAEIHHAALRDFHIRRGVFVPLEPAEQACTAAPFPRSSPADQANLAVFAELDQLQRRRSGWVGPLVLLLVSIGLFLLIGFRGVSWTIVLALVPILFLHECGHYLAMKAFGYRDLRMFFIPALGAAVTGRHYNIAGWKKGVVFLMGPVPGIVLGIFLGLCGIVFGSDFAVKAALLTLVINTFNLLPILPLDGGHLAHIVLFSRHSVPEILFRSLAAVAIIALALASGSQILIALAAVMFITLPQTMRISRIVRELRREGLPAISPDDQTVPQPVAERIIAKVTAGSSKLLLPRLVAQQTLQIFEALNTRPPGWLASSALLSVHALSFIAGVLFSVVFAMSQHGALTGFMSAAANRPAHAISAPALQTTGAAAPTPGQPASHNTVVATFPSPDAAAAAYQEIAAQLPGGQQASVFANTVFVRFSGEDDEARRAWLAHFDARTDDVFVDSATLAAHLNIQAIAPTPAVAARIEDELTEYFRLPLTGRLAAPWSPVAPPTPEQRSARQMYSRLLNASHGLWQEPELMALDESMSRAQRRGDQAEYKALEARYRTLRESISRSRTQAVADSAATDAQRTIAARYLELLAIHPLDEAYELAVAELAPFLGAARVNDDDPPGTDPTYAAYGYAARAGLIIDVRYVSFGDPAAGAAALTEWLAGLGCRHLRYEFIPEPVYDEDDFDPPDAEDP